MKQRMISSLLVFALTLNTAFATNDISDESLPDFGDPSRVTLTPADEKAMGKDFMIMVRGSGQMINDPIDDAYLSALGERLMRGSPQWRQRVSFFWFASPSINAFTGPDGYIGVHSQLMLATTNEDELAGVMAHEIGHVVQGHLARSMALQSKVNIGTMAAMLGALALGIVAPGAAAGAVAATMAGGQETLLDYSRAHEAEADRAGMKVLANAQFNPWGMPNFFGRLLQDERLYQRMPALLNDHPLTQGRIADTENRASNYPKQINESPLIYYLIKERIRVQTAKNTRSLINYYQRMLAKKNYENEIAARYGYGLALMINHNLSQSMQVFNALLAQYPDNILFNIELCDAFNQAHQSAKALEIIEPLYNKKPENYAVVFYYVETLLNQQQAKKALDILDNDRLNYPNHPIPYRMLADAQSKSGQLASAYQTRANYLITMGATSQAMDQLKMALRLPNIDNDSKDRIQAQLDQLRSTIKKT